MAYKNIIVSVEGADDEKALIVEAVRLAKVCKAKLSAVHVNDLAAGKAHMMMGGLPKLTQEEVREQFRRFGFDKEADEIDVVILEGENYPKEIANAAKNADVLIVGHHRKNRLLAALVDSVDERISDLICCPMLVVPCDT